MVDGLHGEDGRFHEFALEPDPVDEVLVVPKSMAGDPERLANMVRQVNEDAVKPEDRLSDNVYEYDSDTQTLKIASDGHIQDSEMSMSM
jgi:hypothetical protein